MASFFQPGPATQDTSTTPSPASQAEQKLRVEMLGRFLDSMAGTAPSFASFVKGGPAQRQFPSGFGPDIAALLNAMNQPGAFTSTGTQSFQGATPSGISDITQLAGLIGLISQATGLNPFQLAGLLKGVGGGAGTPLDASMAGSPNFGQGITSVGTGDPNLPEASLGSILGAGDPSTLPAGYGVLDTSSIDPTALNALLGLG